MKTRTLSFVSALALSGALIAALLVTPASAKKKPPPPPPPPPPPATWSTYVKDYVAVVDGAKCNVTPEAVQTTSDGGSLVLALLSTINNSSSSSCVGSNWLVKLDASGTPQWHEVVGCVTPPAPGGYAFGLSLRRTSDGGFVIVGGTRDCESNPICPYLTSIQCGLVQKLDAAGRLLWTRVYSASPTMTSFEEVRQTSDGGFVVAGSFIDADSNIGALILKLDGQGNVRWQRKIGPAGGTDAYFYDVHQTANGGFVAAGELAPPTSCQYAHGCGQGVLVVKLDANGNVAWQRAFNSFDSGGTPTASEHALTIAATSDGGSIVAGNWGNSFASGACCRGALLLKLDANGNSQWQKAYSGGVHCYSSFGTTCSAIGPLVYSVHQTSDGGYFLAGTGNLKDPFGAPLAPWLARVDASGNLRWNRFYSQGFAGGPSSQYFASADLTSGGGFMALGFTTSVDSAGALFAVKTDGDGLVGSCSQVREGFPLDVLDPGLATIAPALPVQTTTSRQGDLPARTQPTSIGATAGQC